MSTDDWAVVMRMDLHQNHGGYGGAPGVCETCGDFLSQCGHGKHRLPLFGDRNDDGNRADAEEWAADLRRRRRMLPKLVAAAEDENRTLKERLKTLTEEKRANLPDSREGPG